MGGGGGGEFPPPKFWISPPNNNKFRSFLGYSSHFLSPQKQFPPPQNYISRKNPGYVSTSGMTNVPRRVLYWVKTEEQKTVEAWERG